MLLQGSEVPVVSLSGLRDPVPPGDPQLRDAARQVLQQGLQQLPAPVGCLHGLQSIWLITFSHLQQEGGNWGLFSFQVVAQPVQCHNKCNVLACAPHYGGSMGAAQSFRLPFCL